MKIYKKLQVQIFPLVLNILIFRNFVIKKMGHYLSIYDSKKIFKAFDKTVCSVVFSQPQYASFILFDVFLNVNHK